MFFMTSLFYVYIALETGLTQDNLILIALELNIVEVVLGEPVLVTVEQGVLEGEKRYSRSSSYLSFRGIPYAQPPLGELRFQAPRPALKWKDIRSAKDYGPICMQPVTVTPTKFIIGSEDCLYLNVYTPNLHPQKPKPVMFYIHGGGFMTGSGNDDLYGPDFLMDYDVILVTCNYRLNALGFLSVDTKDVPGNAGLKDQIAALQWVQRNIRRFGGDPDMVTIFGQSVGGTSVGLHLISPAAKGLFKRAIIMSLTSFNQFSTTIAHEERGFNLGRRLNIFTKDREELIKSLRNLPAEKLVVTRPNILLSEEAPDGPIITTYFTPIVEKKLGGNHYLTEELIDLKNQGIFNKADLLMGHTNGEGITNTLNLQNQILHYYQSYKELYVPVQISRVTSPDIVLRIGEIVKNYYFGEDTVTLTNFGQFIRFYSFMFYEFGSHYYMDNMVTKSPSTRRYYYEFAVYSSRNAYSKPAADRYGIRKAAHRDDLPYLFSGSGFNLTTEIDKEASEYIHLMCSFFTNFAKYGTPTPNKDFGFIWPEYDAKKEYVRISDKLTIDKVQYTGELGFWNNIYRGAGVAPHLGS